MNYKEIAQLAKQGERLQRLYHLINDNEFGEPLHFKLGLKDSSDQMVLSVLYSYTLTKDELDILSQMIVEKLKKVNLHLECLVRT